MSNMPVLKHLVQQQKAGRAAAIASICSSHPLVIEAAIDQGVQDGSIVLIEATANQVNQYGGYTGLKPADFGRMVQRIAAERGLPTERLILGGDHLGPLVWQKEPEDTAMAQAEELIRQYVLAGYSKIHLDASMLLGSDPSDRKLPVQLSADRAARLARAAADACAVRQQEAGPGYQAPVFVIGSEVPIPGGAQEQDEILQVTTTADLDETLRCFRAAFASQGIASLFDQVIAVVVQPGVEFGDSTIHAYDRAAASELVQYMQTVPSLVLEGHSTDYQRTEHLQQMAEDGVGILKVGPALTFALREGLVALEHLEKALFPTADSGSLSRFTATLDRVMLQKPGYWKNHYHGDEDAQRLARLFSLSDRCRYYLGEAEVAAAIDQLVHHLSGQPIPLPLLSQYLPEQYWLVRSNQLRPEPLELLKSKVRQEIGRYPAFKD